MVGVQEAGLASHVGEPDCHDSLQYFGDGFEENHYAEGGRCVVGGFAWFVQDYPVGVFEAGQVVAHGDEGGEQFEEDGGLQGINPLPDPVGYAIRARSRGGGTLAQSLFDLF